jgi:hypothetical protein
VRRVVHIKLSQTGKNMLEKVKSNHEGQLKGGKRDREESIDTSI